MKHLLKLILALLLLALPFVGRWYYYYPGRYTPPALAQVNVEGDVPERFSYQPIVDDPQPGNDGYILFDLAHTNNLPLDDLTPLRERLAVRGATFDNFSGSGDSLEMRLRQATALVVLAPSSAFSRDEREAIEAFVADGGRLLLAADPTRPILLPPDIDPSGSLSGLLAISAVPAINSLAGSFGLVFFDDYLYNLTDNESNYRNVHLTAAESATDLTDGVETVTFLATHSLHGDGQPLIVGDAETLSSVRSGETDLAAVMLGAEGQVLALGDMTFLTAPYHTIADNDRFLSNIADWLAIDSRVRDLADYPFLFDGPVDLVQASDGFLDARLIARSGALQAAFERADLDLSLQAKPNPDHDNLFVGTFGQLELVQDYLIRAGITVTLIADDQAKEESGSAEAEAETTATPAAEGEAATEATPEATPEAEAEAPEAEAAPEEEAAESSDQEASNQDSSNQEASDEKPQSRIEVAGLGMIGVEGTSLFVVDETGPQLVVVALAQDGAAAIAALEQLASGDFSSCVLGEAVTVCSTGEGADGVGLDTETGAESKGGDQQGRIFILADDDGASGSRTSAADLAAMLEGDYEVTVWSTKDQGAPSIDDAEGYDLYIVDSGDYAFEQSDFENFFALSSVLKDVVVIGQQPFMSLDQDFAAIDDLSVVEADHPLVQGLPTDAPILLSPVESGNPALVISSENNTFGEGEVVMARGPDSAEAGSPALVAVAADDGTHLIVMPFALYRLPEAAQETLVTNIVNWIFEKP